MCDVRIIAVSCSESVECFSGMISKFFFKFYVTVPLVPINSGMTTHFMFHIRCIFVHKLLYFSFLSASFCVTFLSAGIATSIIIIIIVIFIYTDI